MHFSSLELNEKVTENSHWDLQLRIIHFPLISTFSNAFSVWKRKHTHTCVISGLPKAIRGSEIGNGYFQQLPDVSGDLRAKQLSHFSREYEKKIADFPVKTSKSSHGNLVG